MIPYYIRDLATENRILVGKRDCIDFLRDCYLPMLDIAKFLGDSWGAYDSKMTDKQKLEILLALNYLHNEIQYYQSIIEENFIKEE